MMGQDLLTALALVLIIEGLLPLLAPAAWQKAMQELSRYNPRVIRIGGIISMLSGAVLLQFLN
jgi:uncharacterized protein YjeT (DUF2065 family)